MAVPPGVKLRASEQTHNYNTIPDSGGWRKLSGTERGPWSRGRGRGSSSGSRALPRPRWAEQGRAAQAWARGQQQAGILGGGTHRGACGELCELKLRGRATRGVRSLAFVPGGLRAVRGP